MRFAENVGDTVLVWVIGDDRADRIVAKIDGRCAAHPVAAVAAFDHAVAVFAVVDHVHALGQAPEAEDVGQIEFAGNFGVPGKAFCVVRPPI